MITVPAGSVIVSARDLQIGDQLVNPAGALLPPIKVAVTVADERGRNRRHVMYGDRVRLIPEAEPVRVVPATTAAAA